MLLRAEGVGLLNVVVYLKLQFYGYRSEHDSFTSS